MSRKVEICNLQSEIFNLKSLAPGAPDAFVRGARPEIFFSRNRPAQEDSYEADPARARLAVRSTISPACIHTNSSATLSSSSA